MADKPKERADWFLGLASGDLRRHPNELKMSNYEFELHDPEKYKEKETIRNMFSDPDGNFNEEQFNKVYDAAAESYSEFEDYQVSPKAVSSTAFDIKSARILGLETSSKAPIVEYNTDPYKGRSDTQSLSENAQVNNAWWDTDKNKWVNESVEEGLLAPFKNLFNPKVIARYESEGTHLDRNGREVKHNKGDAKADPYSGNHYYESLGDRNFNETVRSDDVLASWNTVLREGSWAADIWNADGKKNTLVGSLTNTAAKVLPWFTKAKKAYGAITATALGAKALSTLGKAGYDAFATDEERKDSDFYKFFDKTRAFTTAAQTTTSDYAKQNPFTSIEGLSSTLGDIVGQLGQQKAVASLTRGIDATIKAGGKISAGAAKAYMVATQSQGIYEEAERMGLPEQDRAALTASAVAAYSVIMTTPLGDWIIKQPKETNVVLNREIKRSVGNLVNRYADDIAAATKKYGKGSKEVKNLMESIGSKAGTEAMDNVVKKTMGSKATDFLSSNLGKVRDVVSQGTKAIFKPGKALVGQKINVKTGEMIGANLKELYGAMVVEGAEETTEFLSESGIKKVYNSLLDAGYTQNKDVKKRFNFDDFGTELLATALVGSVGGAVGKGMMRYDSKEFRRDLNDIMSKNGNGKIMMDYIANGKKDEVLESINEMYENGYFGSKQYSGVRRDSKGDFLPLDKSPDSNDRSAADIVKDAVLGQVEDIESIYEKYHERLVDPSDFTTLQAVELPNDPLETLRVELNDQTIIDKNTENLDRYEKEIKENETEIETFKEVGHIEEAEKLQELVDKKKEVLQKHRVSLANDKSQLESLKELRRLFVTDDGFRVNTKPQEYLKEIIRHRALRDDNIMFDGIFKTRQVEDDQGNKTLSPLTLKNANTKELIGALTYMDNKFKNSKIGRFSKGSVIDYSKKSDEELKEEIIKRSRGSKVLKNVFTERVGEAFRKRQVDLLDQIRDQYNEKEKYSNEDEAKITSENRTKIQEAETKIKELENKLANYKESGEQLNFLEDNLLRQRADILSAFKDENGSGVLTRDEFSRKMNSGMGIQALDANQKALTDEAYLGYLQGATEYSDYQKDIETSLKLYKAQVKNSLSDEPDTLSDILSQFNDTANNEAVVASYVDAYLKNPNGFRDLEKLTDDELSVIENSIKNAPITKELKDSLYDKLYSDYVETRDKDGKVDSISINDFKDLSEGRKRVNASTLLMEMDPDDFYSLKDLFDKDFGKIKGATKDTTIKILDGNDNDLTQFVKDNSGIKGDLTFANFYQAVENADFTEDFQSEQIKLEFDIPKSDKLNLVKAKLEENSKYKNAGKVKDLYEQILAKEPNTDVISEFLNSRKSKTTGEDVDTVLNKLEVELKEKGEEGFFFDSDEYAKIPIEELYNELNQLLAVTEGMHENAQLLNSIAKKQGVKGKPHLNTYTRNVMFNKFRDKLKRLERFKNLLEENNKDKTATIKKGELRVTTHSMRHFMGMLKGEYRSTSTGESVELPKSADFLAKLETKELKEAMEIIAKVQADVTKGLEDKYTVSSESDEFDKTVEFYKAVTLVEDAWYDFFQNLEKDEKAKYMNFIQPIFKSQKPLKANEFSSINGLQYLFSISNEKATSFRSKLFKALGPVESGDITTWKNKFAPIYTQSFHLRMLSAATKVGNIFPETLIGDSDMILPEAVDPNSLLGRVLLNNIALLDDSAGAGKSAVTIKMLLRMLASENLNLGLFASGGNQLGNLENDVLQDEDVKNKVVERGDVNDFLDLFSGDMKGLETAFKQTFEEKGVESKFDHTFSNGKTVSFNSFLIPDKNNAAKINIKAVRDAARNIPINHDRLAKMDHIIFDEATNISGFQIALINEMLAIHNERRRDSLPLTLTLAGDSKQDGYQAKEGNSYIDSNYASSEIEGLRLPRGSVKLRSSYDFLNATQQYFEDLYIMYEDAENESRDFVFPNMEDRAKLKAFTPKIFNGKINGKDEIIGTGFFKDFEQANEALNLKGIVKRAKEEGKDIFIIVDEKFDAQSPDEGKYSGINYKKLLELAGEDKSIFKVVRDRGYRDSVQGSQADYVFHLSSTYRDESFSSGKHAFTMVSRAKKAYINLSNFPYNEMEPSLVNEKTGEIQGGIFKAGYRVNPTEVVSDASKVKLVSSFSLDTPEGKANVEELYNQARKVNAAMAGEIIQYEDNKNRAGSDQDDQEPEKIEIEEETRFASKSQQKKYRVFLQELERGMTANFGIFYSDTDTPNVRMMQRRVKLINDNDEIVVKRLHEAKPKGPFQLPSFGALEVFIKDELVGLLRDVTAIDKAIKLTNQDIESFEEKKRKKHFKDDVDAINGLNRYIDLFSRRVEQLKQLREKTLEIEKILDKEGSVTLDISKAKITKSDLRPPSYKVFNDVWDSNTKQYQKRVNPNLPQSLITKDPDSEFYYVTKEDFYNFIKNEDEEGIDNPIVYASDIFVQTVPEDDPTAILGLKTGTPYVLVSTIEEGIGTKSNIEQYLKRWQNRKNDKGNNKENFALIPLRQKAKSYPSDQVLAKLLELRLEGFNQKGENESLTKYINRRINELFGTEHAKSYLEQFNDVFFNKDESISEDISSYTSLAPMFDYFKEITKKGESLKPSTLATYVIGLAKAEGKESSQEQWNELIESLVRGDGSISVSNLNSKEGAVLDFHSLIKGILPPKMILRKGVISTKTQVETPTAFLTKEEANTVMFEQIPKFPTAKVKMEDISIKGQDPPSAPSGSNNPTGQPPSPNTGNGTNPPPPGSTGGSSPSGGTGNVNTREIMKKQEMKNIFEKHGHTGYDNLINAIYDNLNTLGKIKPENILPPGLEFKKDFAKFRLSFNNPTNC